MRRASYQNHANIKFGAKKGPAMQVADRQNCSSIQSSIDKATSAKTQEEVALYLTEAFRLLRNVTRNYIRD